MLHEAATLGVSVIHHEVEVFLGSVNLRSGGGGGGGGGGRSSEKVHVHRGQQILM